MVNKNLSLIPPTFLRTKLYISVVGVIFSSMACAQDGVHLDISANIAIHVVVNTI